MGVQVCYCLVRHTSGCPCLCAVQFTGIRSLAKLAAGFAASEWLEAVMVRGYVLIFTHAVMFSTQYHWWVL